MPSKTMPALSESVLYGQHLMLLYDLVFCAKKQNAASKNVPVIHLEKKCRKVQSVQSVRTLISVLYGLKIRAGYGL